MDEIGNHIIGLPPAGTGGVRPTADKETYMLFSSRSKTARVMLASLAGLFVALLAVGLLVTLLLFPFEAPFPYAVGLLLGTGVSALKVVLLDKSLDKSLDMEGKQAQNYAGLHAILRYGLTIGALACAIVFRGIVGVFGVALGILALQLSAYITNHMLKKHPDWV